MNSFLKSIADAYKNKYADLSDFLFVFPSKRSASFFLKHLNENYNNPSMAPATITISELLEEKSGLVVDNRIDLLFLLYNAYEEICKSEKEGEKSSIDFESFRMWGDVVLSDFNDIDMYFVDPESIFSNVEKFKEILTDFSTEEQKRLMAEYFGVEDKKTLHSQFWQHYNYKSNYKNDDEKRSTEIKTRFIALWKTLFPLYQKFNESLDKEELAYSGKAYRHTYDLIKTKGKQLFDCKKIVFAGFNALTKIEWLIFYELKLLTTKLEGHPEEPFADFIWDYAGNFLKSEGNSANKFLKFDIRHFPKPAWLDLSDCDPGENMPEVEVIASPSNSLQAKIAAGVLDAKDSGINSINLDDANVAIVLPDESLLFPLLNALPESIERVNLTMGYPLKLTSVYTFVDCLRRLQVRKQISNTDEWQYNYEDVKTLFSHPFIRLIASQKEIENLKGHISKLHKHWLTKDEIIEIVPASNPLFTPITPDSDVADTISYIQAALNLIKQNIENGVSAMIKLKLDTENIEVYHEALVRLHDSLINRGIKVDFKTLFSLCSRLLASEKVNFKGEPLQGLQIMGLLETRCLDFDYLIIPSMNENIFPRRLRVKSFIPNSLRRAFGMSGANYQESIFSYYFYRLITRAKKVWLTYDSRDGENQSGEMSRYILQLLYLYKPKNLKRKEAKYKKPDETKSIDINKVEGAGDIISVSKKDDFILSKLNKFKLIGGNESNSLSASNLKDYLQCSLRFYFKNIVKIKEDEEPSDSLDAISLGNIIHDAMCKVYLGQDYVGRDKGKYYDHGKTITKKYIEDLLSDEPKLEQIIIRCIVDEYYGEDSKVTKLNGQLDISKKILLAQFKNILNKDLTLAPFILYGCEVKNTIKFPLNDKGEEVNMKFIIDRIDEITDPVSNEKKLRIIDYKTGSTHIKAADWKEMFNGHYEAQNFFQLQLYANLFNMHRKGGNLPIHILIYDVPKIGEKKETGVPQLAGKDFPVYNEGGENEKFLKLLLLKLHELFNVEIPFQSTSNKDNCKYCPYKPLCNK